MTDTATRRRRRMLLVPLLGMGVAAWAVRRHLGERPNLDDGWQTLPPAGWPRADATPPAEPAPVAAEPVAAPVAEAPVEQVPVKPAAPKPAAAKPAKQAPVKAAPPKPAPAEQAPVKPASEPTEVAVARAVPAAAAVASITAPARPDVPGSLRALADGSSPDPGYTVKGKSATRIFHTPGGAYYTRTRADVWFRTAADARAAGFTERERRHR